MSTCPVCGSQMSYVNQYQQWYCYHCKAYRQPRPPPPQQHQQPPPQPAPPPPPPQQAQRPVQQQQYQQPAQPAQPHQYPPQAPPVQQQYGAPQYAAQDQKPKTASAYYLAIVALIFAFLGGIVGMILAAVAGWLAKKQAAQGLAKAQQAEIIASFAFVIAMVVFLIIVALW